MLRAPIPLPDRRYSEPPVRPPPLDPESVEATKLKEVREHFALDEYELETDGIRRSLDDEEKMYLVRDYKGRTSANANTITVTRAVLAVG